ncbi:MAG: LysE family transporter [Bacteroidota bacterium]|nr:LysE family transporter [Bacteroidota bacterium]
MHTFYILVFSITASIIGSLQLGPVNLFVIDTSLNRNKRSALWVSLGGCLPEFIYCAFAVYSSNLFLNNKLFFFVFKILLTLVLVILACSYFLKEPKNINNSTDIYKNNINDNTKFFIKGFGLALFNPQLVVYWLFVLVYFNSVNFLTIKTNLHKIAYILGAGTGALVLLITITFTVNKYKAKLINYINNKYYYKLLGTLFVLIAIHQIISLL